MAKNIWVYITSLIVICLGFDSVYGFETLAPENIDWLMSAYHDWGQHYLGWAYFRNEPWTFPLGHISNYNYPSGTNVGFTDSIPLLALLLKPFSQMLPESFQYFGFFILLSSLLTGFYTIKILEIYKVNKVLIILSAILVGLNPMILYRGMHPALTAHWLILASLYYYLRQNNSNLTAIQANIAQLILLIISALITPYLFLFVLGFNIILPIRHCFLDKLITLKKAIFFILTSFLSVLIIWLLIGMISINDEVANSVTGSYGLYGVNLNAFFNSYGFSKILPGLKNLTIHQYEGFSYLGFGLILFCFLSFGYRIFQKLFTPSKISFKKSDYLLIILLVVITLFAITNRITFGNHLIIKFPIPDFVSDLGNIFRASGRYIWLLYYMTILFAIISFNAIKINPSIKVILFVFFFSMQAYDLQSFMSRYDFNPGNYNPEKLDSEKWEKLFYKFDRIITYPPFENNILYPSDYQDFCYLALKAKKPISAGYVARETKKGNNIFIKSLNQQIHQETLSEKDLFITTSNHLQKFISLLSDKKLSIDYLDGYYLLYSPNISVEFTYSDTNKIQNTLDSIKGEFVRLNTPIEVKNLLFEKGHVKYNVENYTYVGNELIMSGWAFRQELMDNSQDSLFISLYTDNNSYLFKTSIIVRQDITRYFEAKNLDHSGFNLSLYTSFLPPNKYNVGLSIKKPDGSYINESIDKMIEVK